MDKAKAMERLDAIEKEAKELREIINSKNIKFDSKKLYVGIYDGEPYIMVGTVLGNNDYRLQQFSAPWLTEQVWDAGRDSGQSCIDNAINDGFEIHEFSDTREAFKFFLDNYKG